MWLMQLVGPLLLLGVAANDAEELPRTDSDNIWYGELDAGSRVFRFRVENDGKAEEPPTLISLDEGNQVFELNHYTETAGLLQFELPLTGAFYRGTRASGATEICGVWSQRGHELPLCFSRRATPKPTEIWIGAMPSVFQKLQMQFRIYYDGDEESVFLDSVTQELGGFRAYREQTEDRITIRIPGLGAEFSGGFSRDKAEIKGQWTQNGVSLELNLRRSEAENGRLGNAVAAERPQTPKPPYPYEVRVVRFINALDNVELSGTLTKPHGASATPGVVLISGSGPQDRDETIFEHKPFLVLADYLTRHGITVLRYDDRGTGESSGNFAETDSRGFARDARAAFDFLRKYPGVHPELVGLIGHSEGGLVAPMIAAENENVAFIVLLAAPGVTGEEILLKQGELVLRSLGISDPEVLAEQKDVQKAIFRLALSVNGSKDDTVLLQQTIRDLEERSGFSEGDRQQLTQNLSEELKQARSPWLRFFLTYDPLPTLRRVKCPVLALNGENDIQVAAAQNAPKLREALMRSGNLNGEVKILPGLNHLFQTSESGAVHEYQQISETMAPEVLRTVESWIRSVTDRS